MCEPLKNLISDIRVVIVTCNNYSLLACLFKAGFHISQCNPRSQFCPFSIIFVKAEKQRERKGERRNERERETSPFSPLFQQHQEGKQIKLLPLHLPFLIFGTSEERKREKTFFFVIVSFFLVSASPRMEKDKTPSFLS